MKTSILSTAIAVCLALPITAQISGPPSGGNQHAETTQWMGPVSVKVNYSSPDVTGPNGQDRRGHIWGELIPYGLNNLGFGASSEESPSPWRAGANENTTVTVSHDVMVEGQPLAAGTYGLHMIVEEEGPWTIIFSHRSEDWGSFFYDPQYDALRVEVTPKSHEYTEWLNFTFTDRQLTSCVMELQWEDIAVPVSFEAPNVMELYAATIEGELHNQEGFTAQNWAQGALFLANNNMDLEKAEEWADYALNAPFIGQRNATTLRAKARVLMANDKTEEAKELFLESVTHPTGSVFQNHGLGRQMIPVDAEFALEVFKANAETYPDQWPVNVGLMRGYSAIGEYEKAIEYGEKALANVPEGDHLNGPALEANLEKLRKGEDIN
ncbi:MAG: DUF2911 domain-containing protein [Flavobacteriia bacterium]|nr:DUF2911 domain-containing protein [Flavobacteriia bacterium]